MDQKNSTASAAMETDIIASVASLDLEGKDSQNVMHVETKQGDQMFDLTVNIKQHPDDANKQCYTIITNFCNALASSDPSVYVNPVPTDSVPNKTTLNGLRQKASQAHDQYQKVVRAHRDAYNASQVLAESIHKFGVAKGIFLAYKNKHEGVSDKEARLKELRLRHKAELEALMNE